ncbi:hypothetical protein ACMFMG_003890 [Clarireedia jacksonii]
MGDTGGSSSWDQSSQSGQQAGYGTYASSSYGEAQAATQAPYYATPTSAHQSIPTLVITSPSTIATTPLSQTNSPFSTSSPSTFATSSLSQATSSSLTSSASTFTSSASTFTSSPSTFTSSPLAQTISPSPTMSPSTSSSGLSSSQRTAIIAGILGGVGAVLIISLLAIYCLQKRKVKKQGEKGSAEPSTYSQVNSSFAGVPFLKTTSQPRTPQHFNVVDTSYQGAGPYMRGGQPNHFDVFHDSAMETDQFLPTYDQTQAQITAPNPLHLIPTTGASSLSPSDPFASRPTTRDPFTDQNRLSQNSLTISSGPNTSVRGRLVRHDTMGFPLDDEDTSYLSQPQYQPQFSPTSTSISSPPLPTQPPGPPPSGPLPLPPFQFPAPQRTYTNNSTHSTRSRTSSISTTSTTSSNATFTPALVQLLNRHSQIQSLSDWQPLSLPQSQSQPPNHHPLHRQQTNTSEYEYENENDFVSPLNIQGGWGGFGVYRNSGGDSGSSMSRNTSQRTQSSFAPSVVSETELDRLGVGMRF